jgi:hypothetical protein
VSLYSHATLTATDYNPASIGTCLLGTVDVAFSVKLRGESEVAAVCTDKHTSFFNRYIGEKPSYANVEMLLHKRELTAAAFKPWGGLHLKHKTEESAFLNTLFCQVQKGQLTVGFRGSLNAATNTGSIAVQIMLSTTAGAAATVAPVLKCTAMEPTDSSTVIVRRILGGVGGVLDGESPKEVKNWSGGPRIAGDKRFMTALADSLDTKAKEYAGKKYSKDKAKAATTAAGTAASSGGAAGGSGTKATATGADAAAAAKSDTTATATDFADAAAAADAATAAAASNDASTDGDAKAVGSDAEDEADELEEQAVNMHFQTVPWELRAAVLDDSSTSSTSASTAAAKAATAADTTDDATAAAAAKAEKAEKDRLLKVYADKYKARHSKKLSYGKHVDTDVSLIGLLKAAKRNSRITDIRGNHSSNTVNTIPGLMLEIENLGHESLAEQPPELTVELYEHQK